MQYSIVDYQFVVDSSHSLRLDAEFFHPDYLRIQHQLEKIGSQKLIDFQVKIRHPKEIKRNYVDDGREQNSLLQKKIFAKLTLMGFANAYTTDGPFVYY